MPKLELRPGVTIKLAGTVNRDLLKDVVEVVVDTNLHLPSMFTIELYDEAMEWVEDTSLALGKEIEISFDPEDVGDGTGAIGSIIIGEITSLEPIYLPTSQARMLIRGYDKSHRLHRGRMIRTFADKKDSEIATSIASEAGLTAEVDATTIMYPYVLQNNQTNMEFLRERARRIGYQVFASKGKLYFKKAGFKLEGGPVLEWQNTLREFRGRLTAAQQVGEVVASGWDIKTKKAVSAKATPTGKNANEAKANASITDGGKQAFGKASLAVVHRPVISLDEATAIAEARIGGINDEFLQAEGECLGDPDIVAGAEVEIKMVGKRFEGLYRVTAATHTYRKGQYRTRFVATYNVPYTFSHLVGGATENQDRVASGAMPGVVIGMVTNLKDPDNLGRVKVTYPWLSETVESNWARVASPMAGKERGFLFMPEVNDEVLMAFEHDDPHFPYVMGALWNNQDKPPLATDAIDGDKGVVKQRLIKTTSGHVIILSDETNKEQIVIRDKTTKNEIIIDSKENTLTINMDKDIKVTAKGEMRFTADKDIVFAGANIKFTAKQGFEVDATAEVKIGTKANATIEALKIEGTGKAGVTLKTAGLGIVDISPAKVAINQGALEVM